ncbi:MAG: protein kinase [Byssovorax sp.]
MLSVPFEDDALDGLIGAQISSEVLPGVAYRLSFRIGEGGMSVVFYALRVTAEGEVPVVVKVLKPSCVFKAGPTAALIIKKEAIALSRLNERVPPTPFVVRYIDTGTFPLTVGNKTIDAPWVVVEYVHGGAEGTTLSERVEHSVRATGAAFDPARAALAIECLSSGLVAVHEVGVIHRDLKPDNVLCCGFGGDEIFKIADFGVARPAGVATFSGAVVGTPGFVAPELTVGDPKAIGPWSDIFSLSAVFFFLLTGEEYFSARTPAEALVQASGMARRSILDCPGLSPELRSQEQACRSIDFALSCGSSPKLDGRPHRADALAAMLLPWLRVDSLRPGRARRLDLFRDDDDPTQLQRWTWTTLRNPSQGLIIRNVAWDGDGRCMTATNKGLAFWNGATWSEVSLAGLPFTGESSRVSAPPAPGGARASSPPPAPGRAGSIPPPAGRPISAPMAPINPGQVPSYLVSPAALPGEVRFVRRVGAGEWLIVGENATFAWYTTEGIIDVVRLPHPAGFDRFDRLSGDLDDLAVLLASPPGGPPTLCARSGRRWLKPLPLPDVAVVTSLARVEDARWLVTGRGADGLGYVGLYAPLEWSIERLYGPLVRAYLSASGIWEHEVGAAGGAGGSIVWRQGGVVTHEIVDEGFDISATAIDAVGRGWAASAGRIWLRRLGSATRPARWDCLWSDAGFGMPIVSLFADLGVVIAMTAEGGIIEGRVPRIAEFDD